ncbi:YdcF family protein [Burkholderia glumae]|uniref:YdcF family protein n=1 Tax=Burkholderia glumae TaxID=337 RepID=UPI0005C2888E|nr:YdcF family protein [Burkholderia glumae]MCM2493506.1 YdcF family protein [Burkholderia glumae]MCM2543934.1 YdcF family protein [Burkholderia glumae]
MILFNSFVLLFAAAAFWRTRRATLITLGLALLAGIATGWLTAPLVALAESGVAPAEPPVFAGRTAIIVLGAGIKRHDGLLVPPENGLARIARAAELYSACQRSGARCTVIVTGGDPHRHGTTEADLYAPLLLARGVPPRDLTLERRSRTTYENAQYTAPILLAKHYDETILVTSSYQMRRALLDFARFGVTPQPVFANRDRAICGGRPRWTNFVTASRALHEIAGIIQFYAYRRLGWF